MLRATPPIRRVVLVVPDGLRPDAIAAGALPTLSRLLPRSAHTLTAQTVTPSVTACAMASMLTGATPARHGLQGDRFALPRPRGTIDPLPRLLAAHELPSSAFMAEVPFVMRPIAHRIAGVLGFGEARLRGADAAAIVDHALPQLAAQQRGLVVLHWPDADRAGHAEGWMSAGYLDAARALDAALGRVVDALDLADPRTLLIVAADHGGGGIVPTRHDSTHAADTTIPVLLAGGAVAPMRLGADVSLLDIPATIAWALGIPLPASYAGRPLSHAFPAVRLLASDRQVIATAPEPEYIDAVVGECSRR